jgi:hypothetical protein
VNEVLAGSVLAADEMSGGTAGLLTILVLCVAAGFLFYFMSGSLKRLRGNVARGEFGAKGDSATPAAEPVKASAVPRQPDGSDEDTTGKV